MTGGRGMFAARQQWIGTGIVAGVATLSLAVWASGCGDGAVEPAPADPPRPSSVTVTPALAELNALGATTRLSAEVRDQNGQLMPGAAVAWSSNNASVATVDASGLVTAASNGSATITAASGSASGTAAVTVAQAVSAVAVTPGADTLVVADTVRLSAEASDANGHMVAGAEFSWASSATRVAVVDGEGLVTGVAAGEAEITATSSGVTGRAALAILAPVPTTVAVTPDTVAFNAVGQTARLATEVRDQIGRPMEDVAVSWSSGDTLVATVDSAGLVTAVGGGTATITANAGDVAGAAVVSVMQSAASVTVSPAADTITPGDTLRLLAEAFDENGHRVQGADFDWASSDVAVVRVDASGLVTGVAVGRATVTARAGDAAGASEITVENPDRAALVALYEATDGPNWVDSENWLTDAPLADWYGVSTNASGRVVRLDLSGRWDNDTEMYRTHGLYGPLPSELGDLTNLQNMDLQYNGLSGPIPSELGNLTDLRSLALADNDLSGPIPPELGDLAYLRTLYLAHNRLTGSIPAELGGLTSLSSLSLYDNELSGALPPELGSLANLRRLDLAENRLTGSMPFELGGLTSLESLRLFDNALTGPIPRSFLQLDKLQYFYIVGNKGLCVPGSSVFVEWSRGIEELDEDSERLFCNAVDVAVLTLLHERAGGSAWTESAGWLGGGSVEEWHGVSADSLGHVTELDLTRNGLAGQLPPNLGDMSRMRELRIGGNAGLSGHLPQSLARLPLRTFHYSGTGLCAPGNTSFQAWLNAIGSHTGTGVECAPFSDRDILEVFYHATGGPEWTNNENWLTDAPLGEWHGVGVGGQQEVTRLWMNRNNLKGAIPPELGALASLRVLSLPSNNLLGPVPPELGDLSALRYLNLGGNSHTGPIPAKLGSLTHLRTLILERNSFTGAIPPELGNLSSLTHLWALNAADFSGGIPSEIGMLRNLEVLSLPGNNLEGPIPPTIGELANLKQLFLGENNLEGPIPPALGELANLQVLFLGENNLDGPIPSALGRLVNVEFMWLQDNALSGEVPGALGRMSSLKQLLLTNNTGMAGPLPSEMTELRRLENLLAGGTSLCAPSDPGVQTWLAGVHKRRIKPCIEGAPAMAYLTQAVQSFEFPVPMVAGEKALLRVFPTARQAGGANIPAVRAHFFIAGREVHVENIPGKSALIPMEVHESRLWQSANAEIPGEVIQPGLEMVIEVDPEGTLDDALGIARRIPATGRLAVDVHTMPLFDLTLIPFIWSQAHDSSIVNLVDAMAADPENHEMLKETRILLPVGDLDVAAHEPVLSSSNNAIDLRNNAQAIRAMEGGTGYYMGMMAPPVTGPSGIAFIGARVSFSTPSPNTIAHEIGHNMSLFHAPCVAGGPDPSYPYPDGSTGAWGYDFRDGGRLVHPRNGDLMSYCHPQWISDYSFTNALRYRLFDEGPPANPAAMAAATRSLLLWGGVRADGGLYLEPAFVVEAPRALPDSAGEYRITGHSETGAELFRLNFTMPEVADGDGSSSFAFALPVRPGWETNLATITLSGPEGTVTLDEDSDIPMVILRNPRTGQVRGFLRNLPLPPQAAMDAAGQVAGLGLEVLFSRGIPGAEAWRR